MINNIALLLFLSIFVEGFIEYFVSNPDKKQPWLKYVSATIGIVVAVLYKADLFALFGLFSSYAYVGSILTGFVISRGSNYLNDFISRINKSENTTTVSIPAGVDEVKATTSKKK